MQEHFSSISALRIYLRRGDVKKASTWWSRLAEKPLSTHLVQAAMQTGIMHASVNLSHVGYTRDATKVAYDNGEVPMNTLPVCVELLAPKRILDQFIRDQARHLKNTTLIMADGVHISDRYLAEMEDSAQHKTHLVEYIRGNDGEIEIEVEHVDEDGSTEAATQAAEATESLDRDVDEERTANVVA